MRDHPLVSVVIPTRDRNVEVQRAISSALRQTLRDIEVIVVDDGSVDPTGTTVHGIVTDPRVSIHRTEYSGGPSAARNVGTELARASLVAYLDSDDEWHPTKLERQIETLHRGGREAGLCLCGYEVVGRGARRARVPRGVGAGKVVELLDTRHEPTVTSCFLLPTALARSLRFDESLAAYEDLDLAVRISATRDVVTTRSILVRKHVSTDRQFAGVRIIDARRQLLVKFDHVLGEHPAVLARNQLTMAAELARIGRTDDAIALLASIDVRHPSVWMRMARRAQPGTPGTVSRTLDALRRAERFSVRGALWRFRTSGLRWQA